MDRQGTGHRGSLVGTVVRYARIQGPTTGDGGGQRTGGFLDRGLGIGAVVVEDIDVVQPHPQQARVQGSKQILARAMVAIRAGPHVVSGLGRDDQLVPVWAKILLEDPAEVGFGGAVWRAVIVGEIEVNDTEIECLPQDRALCLQGATVPEVLPQAERYFWKQQAATPGPPVGHGVIALGVR